VLVFVWFVRFGSGVDFVCCDFNFVVYCFCCLFAYLLSVLVVLDCLGLFVWFCDA